MPDTPDWGGPRQLGQLLSATFDVQADEAGVSQTAIAAVAGRQIVVTQLSGSAVASISAPLCLRDWVVFQVLDLGTSALLAQGAISPSQPSSSAPIVGDAASTVLGNGLELFCQSRFGAGKQAITVKIVYYLS